MTDISNQELALKQQRKIYLKEQLAEMTELYDFLIRYDRSSEVVKRLRRSIILTSEDIYLLDEEIARLQGGREISA